MTIATPMPTFYPYRFERTILLGAACAPAFAYLDDPARLAGHMSQSSWRMGGSRMQFELDAQRGQAVGSHIVLRGSVLGLPLFVDEVVLTHDPPHGKVWETVDRPRLIVIGAYRMGFELTPDGAGCWLRLFIDYALPDGFLSRWLGRWLGPYYARWCVNRMCEDALATFPVGT